MSEILPRPDAPNVDEFDTTKDALKGLLKYAQQCEDHEHSVAVALYEAMQDIIHTGEIDALRTGGNVLAAVDASGWRKDP